jgi:Dolichyl-phosphate-mannose-protein mannosyltransferase
VKNELASASEKPETRIAPALNVEIELQVAASDESPGEGDMAVTTVVESPLGRWLVLAAVMLIAGIYVGFHIGRGWVPADDGTLSQSALRAMQGQLPHRDFAEIYSGGLSFIHALAFRAFGVNLMSLRICVFLFFLAWLPAVYYIALRFTSAIAAGAITLLAVVWSYPNYPAAMPSWYNLFFATFGAAALLRYLEVRTKRWLFVAGVCGGVSILIKVIGAYFIAGALLFLAFLEQSENSVESSCERSVEDPDGSSPSLSEVQSDSTHQHRSFENCWLYRVFSIGSLLLFLTVLIRVLGARLGPAELYQFVLPSAAVVGLMMFGERKVRAGTGRRFQTILRLLVPLVSGIAAPIVLFLIPYARSGMVKRLLFGVSSSAISRSAALGVIRPLGIEKLIWVLPLVGILAAAMYWEKFQSKAIGAAIGLGALAMVARSAQSFDVVYRIWCSAAVLTPVAVLLGVVAVAVRKNRDLRTTLERQQVVLLISLAATCSLVQFPFAAAIYLSYAVPLTLLAVLAIVSTSKTQRGTYVLASVLGLYLAFGVVSLVPRYIYELTYTVGHMDAMEGPRAGGLKIDGAVFFDTLTRFLRQHSPNGLMFAGNDCPELYFLSGLKNITRDDTGEPPEEILKAIRSNDLNLVVLNDAPFFPGAVMQPEVRAEVTRLFPHSARVGAFEVFWKE